MNRLLFFLIFTFLVSNAVTNDQKKINRDEQLSLPHKISSMIDKGQETVNRLRCPKKWSRLGGSCYFLSNITSTSVEANHTCNLLHLNNSQLMYIRHPGELFYAAYILTSKNLSSLLLELDPDLYKGAKIANVLSSNDRIKWQDFGNKTRFKHVSHKGKSYDKDTVDNIDDIRKACHQIKWNVVDNNSNILILTVEKDSNKSICSLSNMELTMDYSHLCQYVFDLCFNNILCGKHGHCVNSATGFKCSCLFLHGGAFCEEFSSIDIQNTVAVVIIVMVSFLTNMTVVNYVRRGIKWLIKHYRRQQPITPNLENKSIEEQQRSRPHPVRPQFKFHLSLTEQRNRFIIVAILTIIFFLILFAIPAIYHVKLSQPDTMDSFQFDSLIEHDIRTIGECGSNTIFRVDNFIFLFVSITLVIIFSLMNKRDIQHQENDNGQSSILEPIKLLYITDRYKTATIVAIQTFEILEILAETLIDTDESSQSVDFFGIFKRMFFIILIGFRYYPILASLQLQNIIVRLLTFIYIIVSMIYMFIRGMLCVNWLPFSKNYSSLEQAYLYMDISTWSIGYGLAKNGLYCCLVGYISAELTMRLFYDSIYIARKNGRKIGDLVYRETDKYSYSMDHQNRRIVRQITTEQNNIAESENNPEQEGCWVRTRKYIIEHIRKYLHQIYQWEDNFRFTTMVISTYTVAFIILFHLTSTFIFLYTTQKKSYMTYSRNIFNLILNIEVEEWSFHDEVIVSAIITMIFYGIQLFLSIKNYRKNMNELYRVYSHDINSAPKLEEKEIILKSMRYPGCVLLYLLGGYVICFNLIFFILTILNTILNQTGSFKWELRFITSILVLYCLQRTITRLVSTIFTGYHVQDENDLGLNTPYSILMYFNFISSTFIGIISSIIRLIISVLVHILFMPRIDYSYLVPPLQKLDTAHTAYVCFLRLEILYTYPILLAFSSSVQMPSNTDTTVHESIAEQQFNHGEYAESEDTQEAESYIMNEISQNNRNTETSSPWLPSRQPHHGSLTARGPSRTDFTFNDDGSITRALLHDEVITNEQLVADNSNEISV